MHDIEPYYNWRGYYIAAEDPYSPFFEREYSEFEFSSKIYNYYIHPQWDSFGSQTLFMKVLYCHYENGFAIIELIGERISTLFTARRPPNVTDIPLVVRRLTAPPPWFVFPRLASVSTERLFSRVSMLFARPADVVRPRDLRDCAPR